MEQSSCIKKSLLWDITRQCNLNCIHCYNSGGLFTAQELNIASDYKTIIDRIAQAGINHIHLLGGEPLLVKGLEELLSYASSRNILVSINTNGTLLSKEMTYKLIELGVSQLTISLDGATELTNDFVRGTGSYKQVTENIRQTMSAIEQTGSTMLVQVATVVTKQNVSTIHRMPRVLQEIGVKYLDVLKLYECGNAVDNGGLLHVSNEEYLNALGKMLVECYRNQIFAQFDCKPKVLELLNLRYGFSPNYDVVEFAGCSAGKRILFMDNNGYIFPCGPYSHEVSNPEFTTNIFDDNYIEQIVKMEKCVRERIHRFSSTLRPICLKCKFFDWCNGCAICYQGHEDLCETALRLFST